MTVRLITATALGAARAKGEDDDRAFINETAVSSRGNGISRSTSVARDGGDDVTRRIHFNEYFRSVEPSITFAALIIAKKLSAFLPSFL